MKLNYEASYKHLSTPPQLATFAGSVQNENSGPFFKKLLRISRQWEQSIKPSTGPFETWKPVQTHRSHAQEASPTHPFLFNQAPQSVSLASKGSAHGWAIWIWFRLFLTLFTVLQQGHVFLSLARSLAFLTRCTAQIYISVVLYPQRYSVKQEASI